MSEMTKMNKTDANLIETLTDMSQPTQTPPTQTSQANKTDANEIQALTKVAQIGQEHIKGKPSSRTDRLRIHQRHTL